MQLTTQLLWIGVSLAHVGLFCAGNPILNEDKSTGNALSLPKGDTFSYEKRIQLNEERKTRYERGTSETDLEESEDAKVNADKEENESNINEEKNAKEGIRRKKREDDDDDFADPEGMDDEPKPFEGAEPSSEEKRKRTRQSGDSTTEADKPDAEDAKSVTERSSLEEESSSDAANLSQQDETNNDGEENDDEEDDSDDDYDFEDMDARPQQFDGEKSGGLGNSRNQDEDIASCFGYRIQPSTPVDYGGGDDGDDGDGDYGGDDEEKKRRKKARKRAKMRKMKKRRLKMKRQKKKL